MCTPHNVILIGFHKKIKVLLILKQELAMPKDNNFYHCSYSCSFKKGPHQIAAAGLIHILHLNITDGALQLK